MSDPYVTISQKFSDDPRVQALEWRERALLFMLLVCREMTAFPGLILAGRAALAESLRMDLEMFLDSFALLEGAGLVLADWRNRVVYFPDPVGWSCTMGVQSVFRAGLWRRILMSAPSCALIDRADLDMRRQLTGRGAMLERFMDGRGRAAVGEQLELRLDRTSLRLVRSAPYDEPRPAESAPVLPPPLACSTPQASLWSGAKASQTAQPMPTPAPYPPNPPVKQLPDLPPPVVRLPPRPSAPAPMSAMGDDDVVAAWGALVDAAGREALGIRRTHLTITGTLPGASEAMWARAWQELRQAAPAPTIADARRLGEWIKGGGLQGIRIALWDYLCQPGRLAGALDQMQLQAAPAAKPRTSALSPSSLELLKSWRVEAPAHAQCS